MSVWTFPVLRGLRAFPFGSRNFHSRGWNLKVPCLWWTASGTDSITAQRELWPEISELDGEKIRRP